MNHLELWRAMTPDEQRQAAQALWTTSDVQVQQTRTPLTAWLAERLHFRIKFIQQHSAEAKASFFCGQWDWKGAAPMCPKPSAAG